MATTLESREFISVLRQAAAQRSIEVDTGEQFLETQLRLRQLSLKQVALGAEHPQVAVGAALVAQRRQPSGSRQRLHQEVLFCASTFACVEAICVRVVRLACSTVAFQASTFA
jgi:hypothetical protein